MSEEADKYSAGPATASASGPHDSSLIEALVEALGAGDHMLPSLCERLWRHGFVRIDSTGLLAANRYVMPEQIAAVSGDRITLRVTRDELI